MLSLSLSHTHSLSQINVVFDQLRETKNFTGYVLFLEEDHYVSPDFITTANKLAALKKE